MGVYVHVHTCESGSQLSHHDLSLNPELIDFGQTGWPMSSRDPSVSVLTSSTGLQRSTPTLGFYLGDEDWFLVIMHAWETFYWLIH